jgi:hypothetical protein
MGCRYLNNNLLMGNLIRVFVCLQYKLNLKTFSIYFIQIHEITMQFKLQRTVYKDLKTLHLGEI